MSDYRSTLITGLAEQLKRGPRRLRIRQLQNIEFLFSVLERGKSYPFEFVVHTITGYRKAGTGADTLLKHDHLRGDLILLAEEVSAAAQLPAAAWPERTWSVAELAERFDVSTKTIFRWHKRGLLGWRLVSDDGRQRLVFPEHAVQRFVASNVALVKRGTNFSQLTTKERDRIIERARVLFDTQQAGSVNAVAKAIGSETGRAVETIRLILKAYDADHPNKGIFNRSSLQVDADDDRLRIWEAYQDGASLDDLAERFERSAAAIYATLTEMRARARIAEPIEFVPSDEFVEREAAERILSCPEVAMPYAEEAGRKRVPPDLPAYLRQLFDIPLLSPAGEAALFRKMNFLKYQADQLRAALVPEATDAQELDAIDALLEAAAKVKNQIVQSNLRLVVSIAKRHATPLRDFFEIVSDGNVSLMRAVDKFDYSRGFKFSTYCSWAIIKNFARSIPEDRTRRDRYQTGRDEMIEALAVHNADEFDNDYLPALRGAIDTMLDTLDERESQIIRERFGLDSEVREPQTLEQIGKRFGVSKERIRQLEARAMQRLRERFTPNELPALAS